MQREKDRLIDISADGMIDNDELPDFIRIQRELEKMSVTVENAPALGGANDGRRQNRYETV